MMLNAMWALDDFTRENGATLVWPGTHRERDITIPDSDGVSAVMPAGSLCLFLGSTIHNGGPNRSDRPRRGLVMSYCLGWLKPCENPWLSYPPEVASGFDPELARLVGYRQDCPSLNNVDGRCPSELLRQAPRSQAFNDKLTAEQKALIEHFNEMQLAHSSQAA
jgi:ectoine hydroxylase-related dioxygenase (phytanoyl-CoA dioxygenase family)